MIPVKANVCTGNTPRTIVTLSATHLSARAEMYEFFLLQEYSVQLTFREQWTDERLKFNNFGG
jgi:hypothetical protein